MTAANTYRTLPNPDGIPGDIICDRCLPNERQAAFNKDLLHDELSGDEQHVDVQTDQVSCTGRAAQVYLCFDTLFFRTVALR